MDKNKKNFLVTVVILTGIFFRFLLLGKRCFWCDEFLAISLSNLTLAEMWEWVIKNDAHPPLFYGLFHFLLKFTQSEIGLRFLPAVFGASSILMFYLLLKRFYSGKNFLLPLVLFVFSPAAILWSQMVKSYSMITFFSLVSIYCFFSLKTTEKLIYAVGWVVASIVLFYLHNYGGIIFAAQVFTLAIKQNEFRMKCFILPVMIIILTYVPYLSGPLLSQISFVKGAIHSIRNPFLRLGYAFYYLVFGETLSPMNLKIVIPGGLLFLYFFLRGIVDWRKNLLKNFSTIVLVLSSFMFFLIPSTIPQNLVHIQPLFFIIVATGIDTIVHFNKKMIFSLLLVIAIIPSVYFYYRKECSQYHDISKLVPYRDISRIIEKEETAGEVVIFSEPRDIRFREFFSPYSPWDWYYKGKLPLIEVSPGCVKNLETELVELDSRYAGFWLLLNYGFVAPEWNEKIKDFFLDGKSVTIKEQKLLKNYSFLQFLRERTTDEYFFLEFYHILKDRGEKSIRKR